MPLCVRTKHAGLCGGPRGGCGPRPQVFCFFAGGGGGAGPLASRTPNAPTGAAGKRPAAAPAPAPPAKRKTKAPPPTANDVVIDLDSD
mmetsp:Transcript_25585/g.85261  ORF Transcript_25585/g.85261 Transcript_25585/m.85261 type:complete len:88 (-) Transcript_25585:217-480(-)